MVVALMAEEPEGSARAGDLLRRLPRNLVKNALAILAKPEAILRLDPEHYDVVSLRTPSRRVRVYKSGDNWKCRSDPTLNQDQPCSHILALLIHLGDVERPNTAADVWKKSKDGRDHALEEQAWRLVPTLLPKLLGDLLRDGLAAFGPAPKPVKRGRPWKPVFPQAYQAVMRAAFRENLRSNQGSMTTQDNLANNPYGPCGRSTIGRFLANPEYDEMMQKFLALSTWPARDYESLFHPDGTGLTEQHFTQFFEEKHHKPGERRQHQWNFAEFLWTYRYTLIAAAYTQRGPFGEAPWLLPLLERASIVFNIEELGGDKAYVAHYIYRYARERDIDVQIKLKKNANASRSSPGGRAYKDAVHESRINPEGYAAKANRRSNAEAGNHAFKAFLGDQIYSKNPVAQRNEILCMCIAYNLTRLIYLGLKEGVEIDFKEGARHIAQAKWVPLAELHRTMTVERSGTRRLA